MTKKDEQPSMFQSILEKRKRVESESEVEATLPEIVEAISEPELRETTIEPDKRKPGRPKGRRSNPEYTQISAYIPLDLLLDVQDELAKEKRRQRKRTALTVSELAENLLREWLKNQQSE